MENVADAKEEVSIDVQDISLIVLQTGHAVEVISSENQDVQKNEPKNDRKVISHVDNNTMLQYFLLNKSQHCRHYVCINAIWEEGWGLDPSWRLNGVRKR